MTRYIAGPAKAGNAPNKASRNSGTRNTARKEAMAFLKAAGGGKRVRKALLAELFRQVGDEKGKAP